jgi:outer membrane beta-barrel protein
MNTASRWMLALGLAVASTTVAFGVPTVQAQDVEVTGPLAGAPAVRKMRIYRKGRFQLQPTFGATLNDEFVRTLMFGVQMGYHFTDWLGLQVFYNYAGIGLETGLTEQVESRGLSTSNNRLSLYEPGDFSKQIGRMNYMFGAQATFIPLRGKLSLFQALFVDTDFYIFAGAAFTDIEERANVTDPNLCTNTATLAQCADTQTARESRLAIAPTFGVGLSMYFTDYLALTLEYRAFPFKWNTSGTDEGGMNRNRERDDGGEFPDGRITEADRQFHFNQMFVFGLAFYLPPAAKITE